jgi:pimeloyl-ACP methyl ester carboxylesterase/predicted ATPase
MQSLLDWWLDREVLGRSDTGLVLRAAATELEGGLPETLAFLIDRQLDRLDEAQRAILEAGSVAGAVFPSAAVAAALSIEPEEVERKADDMARNGPLLRRTGETAWPDGTVSQAFGFRHQLYREALYQRLGTAARQRMHRAVGQRLEAAYAAAETRPTAEIAMHFVECRDFPHALDFLEEAASQALRRGAVRDAVALLERALKLLGNIDEGARADQELRLQAVRGPALVATKGYAAPEAETAFRRAWELAGLVGDDRRLSGALFGLAALKEFRGEYLETQELLRQVSGLGGPRDPSLELACAELMACSTFHNASFAVAVQESDRTACDYRAERDLLVIASIGENPLVSCHCWAGRALWFLGRVEEAIDRLEAALGEADRSGHSFTRAVAHEQMARLRQHRGEPSLALSHATRAIAFGEEYGFPYRVAAGKVLRGWSRSRLGDPAEGMADIEEGLSRCLDLGAVIEFPYFLALQAEALQAAGRPSAGLAILEEARRQAQSRRGFFYDAEILRLIGRLRLPGDETAAEEAFCAARDVARRHAALEPETRAAIDLARLWLRQGRTAEACRLLDGLDPPLDLRPAGPTIADAMGLLALARERSREPDRRLSAPIPAMQQVRFCLTADRTRIAWSETGQGRPLVKAGNWLTHLEFDWQSPIWQPTFSELSESCRLIRYDPRGTGLSDREPPEITFERWVDDLEAVADAAGLDRFALLGISQGAAVSIAYAVRHPERVSHLVLLNGYARGRLNRGMPDAGNYLQALITLIRQGWGGDHPAHRQMFCALYLPQGNAEQVDWFVELERVSASPEEAVRMTEIAAGIDVSGLMPSIATPTLVLHGQRDVVAPFEEGRIMAAAIPGARMVPLDSCNHLLLPDEPAWRLALDETRRFLRD